MALNAYLVVEGQTQGKFKGSVTQKGREDSIMVIAVDHEIVSPPRPRERLAHGQAHAQAFHDHQGAR
jgi:type VI secretion system secreted protein Hcp